MHCVGSRRNSPGAVSKSAAVPIGSLVVPFWDYLIVEPYNYRVLRINHKKELLRSLWVELSTRVDKPNIPRTPKPKVSALGPEGRLPTWTLHRPSITHGS